MPIPKEIRSVKRPVNTIVVQYGKNKDRYAVRKRIGCRRINGKNIPVTGPTIGHIVNGKFIMKLEGKTTVSNISSIEIKSWAIVEICDRIFKPVFGELLEIFCESDTMKIYLIAILRVCFPGIKDRELKEEYENSFLSEFYPGVALSKNTVSKFFSDLGKAFGHIVKFMKNRAAKIGMDDVVIVDGTLKTNDSIINTLSEFSRKARLKGSKDLTILFAYNLTQEELVCASCYPGNMLDATAYNDFVLKNGITNGLIVADKGFPESAIDEHIQKNKNLHYLNPVKRNSKLIETHRMTEYEGILKNHNWIMYKKSRVNGKNKWLYSFRDTGEAYTEEKSYLSKIKDSGQFNLGDIVEKQRRFGTIVFECDLDLNPEEVYNAYSKRWEIELVIRFYKAACDFYNTRVHSDYSIYGSEFCDFLAADLTFKLINEFDRHGLLEKYNYSQLLSMLRKAQKARMCDEEWQYTKTIGKVEKVLQELGLKPKETISGESENDSEKNK